LERELRALLNLESLSKKLLTPTCIAIEAPHPGKGQSFLAVSETVGLLRSFFPEVEHVVLTAAEVRAAVCGSRKAQKADVRFTIEHTVAGWLSGRTAHECDAAAVARAVGDQLYQRYLAKEPGAIARVEARSDEQSRGTIGA
jgi:Holliday junction resolvasome RuvABC endonuclease subunit